MTDDGNTPVRTYPMEISGYSFEARPLTKEQMMVVMSLGKNINAQGIRVMNRILQRSMGEKHWDAVTDMLVDGETTLVDVMGLLEKIATAQHDDADTG